MFGTMSLRRIGTLMVTLIIPATITGCSSQKKYAEAYLQVHRERVPGNAHDFQIFKDTHCQLLRSTFVLTQAQTGENVATLGRELQIESAQDELVLVRLPVGNREPKEAERILDAILKTYEKEVVNRGRLEKVEQLSRVRKRYQQCYDSISEETERVQQLAARVNDPTLSGSTATELEIDKKHVLYLRQLRVELTLDRIEAAATSVDGDDSTGRVSVIDDKLEAVVEMINESETKLARFSGGGASGELQARNAALEGMRRDLKAISDAKHQLEVEIDSGPAITIIQTAVVK